MTQVSDVAGGGPAATTRTLVRELVNRWRRDARVDCYVPYLSLERAEVRLESLGAEELALLEEVTEDLRPAVAQLIADARSRRAPHRRRLRDLNAIARRLACTTERLASSEHPKKDREREALTVRYAEVDLGHRLRVLGQAFDALAAERHVEYALVGPESLVADTDVEKADVAVLNLLFNAFRHAPHGGRVRCVLEADARGGEIVVRIEDSGPRVSPDAIDRMFDPSRPIDRSVRVFAGGVAFDLGTSRDFVALLGGTLQIDPQRSRGASFEIRVPRRAPSGVPVRRRGERAPERHRLAESVAARARLELRAQDGLHLRPVPRDGRPLVLIVEDNQPLHRLLVEVLEPEHATVSALDGATAIERALRLRPDLTLIDLGLPVMEGESVIRALGAQGELARHPVVVLTGREAGGDIERLFELGARDVWRKPFYIPELTARVRALISEKRARDLLGATLGTQERDLFRLAEEAAKRQQHLVRVMEDLEEARANAETASQIKGNFLRMMSHELRTPITAIQLHARILEHQADEASMPSGIKDPLDRIARSSRRLTHLVDGFMEWARAESGRTELSVEDVSLATVAEEVIREMSSAAQQKGVELGLEAPSDLRALATDRRITRLVLLDLVARAVQVTREGRVRITLSPGPSGEARILVHDMGDPVAPGDVEDLFDPLRTGDDLDRRSGSGSGLGLHAVRDIAAVIEGGLELADGNTLVLSLRSLPRDRTTSKVRKILVASGATAAARAARSGEG